jgi:hypothetical protein
MAWGLSDFIKGAPPVNENSTLPTIAFEVLDGWTGMPVPLAGGLTFRFALKVDCHKCWPREEEEGKRFQLRSEFLDLWRKLIGVPFDIVATFD